MTDGGFAGRQQCDRPGEGARQEDAGFSSYLRRRPRLRLFRVLSNSVPRRARCFLHAWILIETFSRTTIDRDYTVAAISDVIQQAR